MHANVNHITYMSCTTQTKTLAAVYAQITRPTAVIYVLIIEGHLAFIAKPYPVLVLCGKNKTKKHI